MLLQRPLKQQPAGAGTPAEAELRACRKNLADAEAALKQQSEKLTHEIELTRKEAAAHQKQLEEDLAKREEDLRRMQESTDKQIKRICKKLKKD